MIFSVGLQIINVNGGQARNEQLQLLLGEDGDQPLRYDLIESFQKGCQLFANCPWKINPSVNISIWHKTATPLNEY